MDSLKYYLGLSCPTMLYARQAAIPETTLQPFQGWLPAEQPGVCGHLLTPHAVSLWCFTCFSSVSHPPNQWQCDDEWPHNMGVWHGVAMDSLKFYPGPPYPTLYALRATTPEMTL
jgi:hypothetical protein